MIEPETTHQLEFAKMDYGRLGGQEQALMNKRTEHWTRFFTVIAIPTGAAGVVGLSGATYLLALVPFLIACIALEIKHDEQVLRYDVRKQMKLLAQKYGFENHDSKFALENEHQQKRFWHGYYKHGRLAAFIVAEVVAAMVVTGYFASSHNVLFSIVLGILNTFFVVFTVWCMS